MMGNDRALTYCRPGKYKIHGSEAQGCDQGSLSTGACLHEDSAGVEGDDVDAAHLLGYHNGEASERRATDTRDSEQLDEAGGVVAVADNGGFLDELRVYEVEISCGLDGGVAQLAQ
jgi:hypothetical protein